MAQKLTKTAGSNSFTFTQVVNLSGTRDNQLLIAIRNLWYGSSTNIIVDSTAGVEFTGLYANLPIAIVKQSLKNQRQVSITKAIVVSPSYWGTLFAGASASLQKQITVFNLTVEFLYTGDRFARVLPRLSPRQVRYEKTLEIINDGGIGKVDVGYPFISTSLSVTGAVITNTFPSLGLLEFGVGDIGKMVDVDFVSDALYNVIKVERTHEQPNGSVVGHLHPEIAYVMHPVLARYLGVVLPVI